MLVLLSEIYFMFTLNVCSIILLSSWLVFKRSLCCIIFLNIFGNILLQIEYRRELEMVSPGQKSLSVNYLMNKRLA